MGSERGAELGNANPPALPTGTVTFLFSDVEGSTERWDAHPDEMKAALARHEVLVEHAMVRNGGYVFKCIGDAFCVAFPTASQAVRAAVDAQRALAEEDFSAVGGLRVRMGIHAGPAEEREADYFGPTLNRTARLAAIGHGGQVLVSGVTRDLAHGELSADTLLIDLGSQHLRDLAEPEHVWQLDIAGLPSEFPPLQSLDTLPNNLPVQQTSFVGRERDIEGVKALLASHHLVTLVGSGGVGKTRLAVQVGADVLKRFPDGVWFVDLAPITDPELVSSVMAKTLMMQQQQDRRVDDSLPAWLRSKTLLLIVDTCEHVLEAVVRLIKAIVQAAPDVRVLSTSRQLLGISGEDVVRVRSLDVPQAIGDLTPTAAAEFGAVALFVDRARSVDQSFALTNGTAPIVADICRRLDGIPLAIELAAARVKVLSIPNLAQRIGARFKILTGGSRDVLPRQRTLVALIDWSYDLLNEQERTLFNRLGVFAGGFGLEAATSVCGDGMDEIDLLDLLGSLMDKSLIVADTSGERERYRLLESMRAYALEKLDAAGERDDLARRHASYFCDLAKRTDDRYRTGSTIAWLAEAETELENDRAALEWTLTHGHDAIVGGALAGALGGLWLGGNLHVEGQYWIDLALARVNESEHPRVAARLWSALAWFLTGKRKYDVAEHAMRLYESVGDTREAARKLAQLGHALFQMGRLDEADDAISRALPLLRACGDSSHATLCLEGLAFIASNRGDLRTARELYAQIIAAYHALGDETRVAQAQGNVAETEFADGHPEAALRFVSEALEQSTLRNHAYVTIAYTNGAAYRIALGDVTGAEEWAREGLRISRQARRELSTLIALQHLALLRALDGRAVRAAARVLGYVDAHYRELGLERERTERWGYDRLLDALRSRLSDDEIASLAAEGATLTEDQAVEEALDAAQ